MTLKSLEVLPIKPIDGVTRVPSTDANYQLVLADAVAETFIVPAYARYVKLVGTKDFYAAYGSTAVTATIASTDADAGNGTELLPYSKGEHWRYLDQTNSTSTGARGISVISSSAQTVTATYWLG